MLKLNSETNDLQKKIMVGEHCRNERVQEPAERFKVEVYFTVLDTLLTQLDERFADFCSTVSHFHCLGPSQLSEDYEDSFRKLCEGYRDDVNVEEAVLEYATFKNVYASIRQLLPDDLKLGEVLPFLIDKQMAPGLPNLSILYKIFLTLPVTSATAERSFSRLKLIKNYFRSTMKTDRLSGLRYYQLSVNWLMILTLSQP